MTRSIENINFSVAFPSSSNTQDRTSVYSVQSSISTNSNDSQPPPPALPYLPFRRISLPSLPPSQSIQHSPLRRQITQPLQPQRSSIASLESVSVIGERERRESNSMARNHLVLKNRDSAVFSNSNSNSPNVTPRKGQRRTAVSMQTGSKPPLMSPMRRKSQGLAALPLDDPLLMKRRKVMLEFYETEKTYVEGLDLIYEHFLLPMLNSLETSSPILERPLLTTVFSNFIDIWNFHRSFLNELTRLFCGLEHRRADSPFPNAHSNQIQELPATPVFPSFPPPLSPLLLTHFPYLSLYTPFIAAFSQTLAALNTLLTPSHYYRQQSRAQTRSAVARAQSSMPSSLTSPSRGTELRYNKRFADFVATRETHPRCGKLQLRDWLLTIVQRCPRYLLLLGDLLSCTPGEAQLPSEDGKEGLGLQEKKEKDKKRWHREATKEEEKEREKLIQVYGLVSKITNSLNTSIWSHSQTLVLLALQRSTPNLPLDEFQFIYPGRTLLKRGTLLQIENPDARVKRGESKDGDMRPREREFLLFSDCLVWLSSEETEKKEKEWNFDLGSIWSSFSGGNGNGTPVKNADVGRPKSAALPTPTPLIVEEEIDTDDQPSNHNSSDNKNRIEPVIAVPRNLNRPPMVRTRSKSEAGITTLQAKAAIASTSQANLPPSNLPAQSQTAFPDVHRPTHKSNFARVNKNHLHFRDRRGRKDSTTSSPRSAGYGGMDHEQWLYKGRIELVNLEIVVDTSFSVEDELEESSNDGFDVFKWRWEVLSPEGSFVLYAASGQERAEWTTLIRQAKSQHLISLHAQHPNSTLTSSEATKHIRRALQALPFAPNDIRMQGYQVDKRLSRFSVDSGKGESVDSNNEGSGNGKERDNATKKHKKLGLKDKNSKPDWYKERRSKVEHWIPAIWIPDEKAEGCMRCGRAFGWRRRRHHCRLCGRCVCSSCSDKTFYITDPNSKDEGIFSKAARACNACYESVFPLIDPHSDLQEEADETTVRARPYPPPLPHSSVSEPTSSSFLPSSTSGLTYASNADTITSLPNLPSWMNMSVPSLASSSSSSNLVGARNKSKGKELSGPEALMAIDSKRYSYGLDGRRKTSDMGSRLSRDSGVVFDLDSSADDITLEDVVQPARSGSRIKLRSQSSSGSRPRSYYDLVEEFHSASGGETPQAQIRTQTTSPLEDMAESDEDAIARLVYPDGEESSALSTSSVNSSRRHTTTINLSTSSSSVSLSMSPPTSSGVLNVRGKRLLSGTLIAERREDTVRRHKRFSIPAVALQTTSVVARTQSFLPETSGVLEREKSVAFAESSSPSRTGEDVKRHTESKLGSLLPGMPGTRSKRFSLVSGGRPQTASSSSRRIGQNEGHKKQEGTDLGMGVAASKLNELLGRSKHKAPGG
ncbi:hypothetical protein F5050DRAFT_1315238 [Lentinula boryana]|uniref:Uncharacterized protein n=1 Tax=Lentinula boryana TaxID=40481 RepID=A0ABQ8QHN1_9AGAR|nr:hypothetical protein F5050DRAFT_1315238 [Lentinula boryana]